MASLYQVELSNEEKVLFSLCLDKKRENFTQMCFFSSSFSASFFIFLSHQQARHWKFSLFPLCSWENYVCFVSKNRYLLRENLCMREKERERGREIIKGEKKCQTFLSFARHPKIDEASLMKALFCEKELSLLDVELSFMWTQ